MPLQSRSAPSFLSSQSCSFKLMYVCFTGQISFRKPMKSVLYDYKNGSVSTVSKMIILKQPGNSSTIYVCLPAAVNTWGVE